MSPDRFRYACEEKEWIQTSSTWKEVIQKHIPVWGTKYCSAACISELKVEAPGKKSVKKWGHTVAQDLASIDFLLVITFIVTSLRFWNNAMRLRAVWPQRHLGSLYR